MATDSSVANYLNGDGDDGELSDDERQELDQLGALLHDRALWAEPDPALENSIVMMIARARDEAAATPRPVFAPPTPASASVAAQGSNVVSFQYQQQKRRSGIRRLNTFVAGIAVAAVLAAAVLGVRHFTNNTASGTSAALGGGGSLPGASGTIRLFSTNSGVRIELDASGLPRLDNGEFYEAWLRSVDGTKLVPVGTFHTGAKVTLWAGVSTADYPTFTVTHETAAGPEDIAQGSSGDVVLKGEISGG